jgi:hypothetical protein
MDAMTPEARSRIYWTMVSTPESLRSVRHKRRGTAGDRYQGIMDTRRWSNASSRHGDCLQRSGMENELNRLTNLMRGFAWSAAPDECTRRPSPHVSRPRA